MRLIDADAVKEEIIDLVEYEWGWEGIRESVETILENIPTAYDVDKVVEQLEKLKSEKEELSNTYKRRDYYATTCYIWMAMGLKKAIEIVEKGYIE